MHFGRHRTVLALALALAATALLPSGVSAQEATLAVDENIRFEPQGVIVARLVAGTPVRVIERQGAWSRITFGGTVWEASLQRRDGGSFDLIVAADEGENLRQAPGGRIIGRLNQGTLLNEVGREPGWIQVERTAWVWNASLSASGGGGTDAAPPPAAATPTRPPAAPPQAPPSAAPAGGESWVRAGPSGTAVRTAPDGDTMAVARGGAELRVTGREGNWARVRIEGWVWLPSTEAAGAGEGASPGVILRDATVVELMREPERFRGRMVSLTLQYISLERAEAVRTDFLEGEPFLLLRSTEADRSFVYVAVPPEQLDSVSGLQPLERLQVVGRVRTGAAALTGNPVLELVEFTRLR
jgi:hypothetical protein